MSALTNTGDYREEIERWHRGRIKRLTAPDGWLSLVAHGVSRHWPFSCRPHVARHGELGTVRSAVRACREHGHWHGGNLPCARQGRFQARRPGIHGDPVLEAPGDKQLFVVFADATSGRETYGAARFLYVDMPHNGRIVLDFNKAYNPPCSFTPHATCPLAPPENRLALRITAGELKPGCRR